MENFLGFLAPGIVYAYIFVLNAIVPAKTEQFTHVRLNIFPDGGISRLRVFGKMNTNKA